MYSMKLLLLLLLLLLTITIVSLLWRSVIIREGFLKKTFRKASKATKQVTKPIAKITQPIAKVAKQVAKPIAKVTKQVATPIAKVAKQVAKPIAKIAKPITKPIAKVAKQIAKPIAKVAKQVAKQIAKPDAKVAEQVAEPIGEIGKFKVGIGKFKVGIGQFKVGIGILKGEIGKLKGEIEEIGGEIGKLKGKIGEIGKLIGEIGRLKGEIGKRKEKIIKLKGEIGKLEGKITSQTVSQPKYGVVIIQDQLKLLNEVQGNVQKIPSYKIQPKDRMEINKSLNIVIDSLETWLNGRITYIKAYNKKPSPPSENQSIDKLREIWVKNGMGLKLIITGIIERLDVTNDLQLNAYNILQKFNEKMNMELGVTLSDPSTIGYESIRPVENVFNDSGRTFNNKLLQYFFGY